MKNPETLDGKSSTTFNQWWEAVTMYLGFYPETADRQKIAWIGTLLSDSALVWHLHRYRELGENDTWVNYTVAIKAEYRNERKAVDTQLKLGQLKYQGSIRAYLTEFRALNNFAWATGEALREKVDLEMPDAVLDMRFAHYLEDFVDDEGFLQATHQAGLQVEKKKALKQAREQMNGMAGSTGNSTRADEKRKEERKREPNRSARSEERKKDNERTDRPSPWGKPGRWATKEDALKGVPSREHEEYFKTPESWWRCGQKGHRTYECFAHTTRQGTVLPRACWKRAWVSATEKRKCSEEPEEVPAPKQQKVAAIDTMEIEDPRTLPIWADNDEESDF